MSTASTSKCLWSETEIATMLDLIIELEGYRVLDSKRQRNKELYISISKSMSAHEMIKTADQCRVKFKHLKSKFMEEKRESSKSGAAPSRWPWYEKLNEIVGRRPAAVSISDGVESHTTQETATQDTTTQDDDGDDDEATESSQFASGTPRPPKRKNAFKDRNQASSAKNSRKEPSQISELVEELREQNTQLGQQIDRCFEGQERMMTQFSEMMNMMMGTTQQTPAPQASPLHHPSSIAPSYHQQQPTQSYQHIPSSQSYQHSPQVPPTYQSYPQHMINFSPPPSRPASAFSPSGSSEGA